MKTKGLLSKLEKTCHTLLSWGFESSQVCIPIRFNRRGLSQPEVELTEIVSCNSVIITVLRGVIGHCDMNGAGLVDTGGSRHCPNGLIGNHASRIHFCV